MTHSRRVTTLSIQRTGGGYWQVVDQRGRLYIPPARSWERVAALMRKIARDFPETVRVDEAAATWAAAQASSAIREPVWADNVIPFRRRETA